MTGISSAFHQRNGERSGGDRVGNGASRDHAEKGAGGDGGLCRSATGPSCQREGNVGEKFAGPGFPEEGSIEDEKENEV